MLDMSTSRIAIEAWLGWKPSIKPKSPYTLSWYWRRKGESTWRYEERQYFTKEINHYAELLSHMKDEIKPSYWGISFRKNINA